MSQLEHGPNPERRSSAALFCFCAGIALLVAAWVLGVGGTLAMVVNGGGLGAVGAFGAGIAALGCGALGLLLSIIGGIWLIIQVIADQTGKDKYSNVER